MVDVQIGNLRRKFDPTGERQYIVSVRAIGFKLRDDVLYSAAASAAIASAALLEDPCRAAL